MKNGKALEPSRLVEEMAKSASEIRINIKDLIKGITIEGSILAEWGHSTTALTEEASAD